MKVQNRLVLLLFGLSALLLAHTAEYFRTFTFLENLTITFRHSIRRAIGGPDAAYFPVEKLVIVAFDDPFFKKYNQFPLLRSDLAVVVDRLEKLGAGVIGVNLFIASNSSCGDDSVLIDQLKAYQNIVFSSEVELKDRRHARGIRYPKPAIRQRWTTGYDNVVSGSVFSAMNNQMKLFPELVGLTDGWPFAVQIVSRFLDTKPRLSNGSLVLNGITAPLSRMGEMPIDFTRIRGSSVSISAHSLLHFERLEKEEQEELSFWIKGKIVLVGYTSGIVTTLIHSPVGPVFGVELNADIISTLLNGGPLRPVSLPVNLWIKACLIALLLINAIVFSSPLVRLSGFIAILALFMAFGTMLYAMAGWIVLMGSALMACLFLFLLTEMTSFIQEKLRSQFIRNAFGRYLTREIVQEIIDQPGGLAFKAREYEVSILMSDIRGYSQIAGNLEPSRVVEIVNNYVEVMAPIVQEYHGIIDEIIGDALLVIFGAPVEREDHAELAVACAVEMQLAMEAVNSKNRKAGLEAVTQGIAVNAGTVVAGNIGSEKRSKWGVVGGNVNLTARIEGYTGGGQIFVSEAVKRKLGSQLIISDKQTVQFKGYSGRQMIYLISGIKGRFNLSLKKPKPDEWHSVTPPLQVLITALRNKSIGKEQIRGEITAIQNRVIRIQQIDIPSDWVKVRITILKQDGVIAVDDVFGIIRKRVEDQQLDVEISYLPSGSEELIFGQPTIDRTS